MTDTCKLLVRVVSEAEVDFWKLESTSSNGGVSDVRVLEKKGKRGSWNGNVELLRELG